MYENEIKGTCRVEKAGDAFCGMSPEPENFEFTVHIEADELDEYSGFVIDVRALKSVLWDIEDEGPHEESGEQLAKIVADRLWSDRFTSIRVTVQSTDFSKLTYTRKREPKRREADSTARRYTIEDVFPDKTAQTAEEIMIAARGLPRGKRAG